ncbi:MAG: tail fiber domain-containing protein, partial [Bacteroidales bacterium]|nr:tail fiber domain-containing protein [Bacteroidales bacterium]
AIDFRIYTSNVERMTVEANGNVGIGTDSPSSKLEIRGTADLTLRNDANLLTSGNDLSVINFGDYYSGSQARILVERGATGGSSDKPTDISFWNTPDGSITLTERMRIMHNGNVGIGTAAPTQKLHVQGNIRATDLASGTNGAIVRTNTNGDMSLINFTGSASDVLLGNGTFGTANTSATAWQLTGNAAAASNFIGTTNAIDFRIYTSNVERMTVEANGNVGIGTDSPSSKLEIRGTADLTLRNDANLLTSGNDLSVINFGDYYSGSQARILVERGATGGSSDKPTDISFWNTPDGSITLTERMRIMHNGNVGIGTAAPTQKLHVQGNAHFAGDGTYTGAWSQVSDIRFKKNISDYNNALDNIMKLRPVTYEMKTEEYPFMNFKNDTQIGFIAQEMEPIFPSLVTTTTQPGENENDSVIEFKGINYIGLTPILVKAIQEQQIIINDLKSEINDLKSKYESLQKQIDKIQSNLK